MLYLCHLWLDLTEFYTFGLDSHFIEIYLPDTERKFKEQKKLSFGVNQKRQYGEKFQLYIQERISGEV